MIFTCDAYVKRKIRSRVNLLDPQNKKSLQKICIQFFRSNAELSLSGLCNAVSDETMIQMTTTKLVKYELKCIENEVYIPSMYLTPLPKTSVLCRKNSLKIWIFFY